MNKMFKWLLQIFAVPVISALLFLWFFYVHLSPLQRNILLKETLASIPGIKQFVNITYKTRLSVKEIRNSNELKTAFYSADYLCVIKNPDGNKYIALYPFLVEAGFDLKKEKIEVKDENKKRILTIHLPYPTILSSDIDTNKDVLIIRDDLKDAKYEYVVQPLKKAFENQAKDLAFKNGILNNAKSNADSYYMNLWKNVYDEIIVDYEHNSTPYFTDFKLPHLPAKVQVSTSGFDYEFRKTNNEDYFFDGFLIKDKSKIWIGYSQKFQKSFNDLFETVRDNKEYKSDAVLKFIDPVSPLDKGVVCAYDSQECTCFVQRDGNLYFISHDPADEEQMKKTLSDVFYLSFNIESDEHKPEEDKYLRILELIKKGREAIGNSNTRLKNVGDDILNIDKSNNYGKLYVAVANALNNADNQIETKYPDINLLIDAYHNISKDLFQNMNENFQQEVISFSSNNKYREFQNNFKSYLVLHQKEVSLPETVAQEYINQISEDAQITWELLQALNNAQLKNVFKNKLIEINRQLKKDGTTTGNRLYCFTDNNSMSFACDNENVYYDEYSLEHIFKKGKDTINNLLVPILNSDPKNHLIIVLSHKGYIFDNFDAVVFFSDGIILFKDLLNGITKDKYFIYKYPEINIGVNYTVLDNDKYYNNAFIKIIGTLKKVHEKSSNGTKDAILTYLKDRLLDTAYNKIWLPTL